MGTLGTASSFRGQRLFELAKETSIPVRRKVRLARSSFSVPDELMPIFIYVESE